MPELKVQIWPVINSFFSDNSTAATQTKQLQQAIKALPKGRVVLMVTHQVNITSSVNIFPQMGQVLVVPAGVGPVNGYLKPFASIEPNATHTSGYTMNAL